MNRPAQALAWSGLAAGFSMGMPLVVEGLLQVHLPDTPWRSLVVRMGYPFGFLMVVGGRQQLFTENTLSPIIPLLERRDRETFWKVVKLWTAVFAANIAGAHIVAWVLSNTPAFQPDVKHAFREIARDRLGMLHPHRCRLRRSALSLLERLSPGGRTPEATRFPR